MSVPDTTVVPNFADARAATQALFDGPDTSVEPQAQATPIDPPTSPAPNAAPGAAPDSAPAPLTWDSIDLSVLPEDQRKFVQDGYLRQSDYTRKTQELADQRKQFEQFGDPETVQQAVEFVSNLQDPDFLMQLNADIQAHLAAQGLNPGAASVAPNVATQPTDGQNYLGLDPATQARLAKIDQFEERFALMEHQAQEAELTSQFAERLQQAEDSIRADYPMYSQDDIDAIYELSPAHGYDLFKSQEMYEKFRNHFETRLVGNKGAFPDAANNVRSDTLVYQPTEMKDFKTAKEASIARFAAANAG